MEDLFWLLLAGAAVYLVYTKSSWGQCATQTNAQRTPSLCTAASMPTMQAWCSNIPGCGF